MKCRVTLLLRRWALTTDLRRVVNAQRPTAKVEPVRTIVCDVTGTVMPVPVVEMVETIPVKWEHRYGSRPDVIIDAGRHGFVLFVPDIPAQLGIP